VLARAGHRRSSRLALCTLHCAAQVRLQLCPAGYCHTLCLSAFAPRPARQSPVAGTFSRCTLHLPGHPVCTWFCLPIQEPPRQTMRSNQCPAMCEIPAGGSGHMLCNLAFPCPGICSKLRCCNGRRVAALVCTGAARCKRSALLRAAHLEAPQPSCLSRGQARGGSRCRGGRGGGRERRRRAYRRAGRAPAAVRIGAAGRAGALRRGRRAPCAGGRGAAAPRA